MVTVQGGGSLSVGVADICLLDSPFLCPFTSLIKSCGEACSIHGDCGWGCLSWGSGYFEAHLEFEYMGAVSFGTCKLISYMFDWICGSSIIKPLLSWLEKQGGKGEKLQCALSKFVKYYTRSLTCLIGTAALQKRNSCIESCMYRRVSLSTGRVLCGSFLCLYCNNSGSSVFLKNRLFFFPILFIYDIQ